MDAGPGESGRESTLVKTNVHRPLDRQEEKEEGNDILIIILAPLLLVKR